MAKTHKAIVVEARGQPLVLKSQPIPSAVPGSAVMKVLATSISPLAKSVLSGQMPVPLDTPVTPHATSIGRIHEVGPDATYLKPGQLVLTDFWTTSRDDPDESILAGYMGGNPLLEGHWKEGTWAEYARVPLERTFALNEEKLCEGGLGYSFVDLVYLGIVCIPFAGLLDIDVRPGDSVIVAPATGFFGGSSLPAVLGLGAKAIICGRNEETLGRMVKTFDETYPGRVIPVKLTGDAGADTEAIRKAAGGKGADKYIDFAPPQSAGSTLLSTCLSALRPGGKCVVMGAVFDSVGIPYITMMRQMLSLQGRYMFERWHVEQALKLLEAGFMKLGAGAGSGVQPHVFPLEDVEEALDQAVKLAGWGNMTVFAPRPSE